MKLEQKGYFKLFFSTHCFHQRSLNHKKTGGVLRAGDSPPPGIFKNKGNCSPFKVI